MSFNYDRYEQEKISVEAAYDLARNLEGEMAQRYLSEGIIPVVENAPTATPTDCPRCGAELTYVTSSVHCPKCGYHEGCCG